MLKIKKEKLLFFKTHFLKCFISVQSVYKKLIIKFLGHLILTN